MDPFGNNDRHEFDVALTVPQQLVEDEVRAWTECLDDELEPGTIKEFPDPDHPDEFVRHEVVAVYMHSYEDEAGNTRPAAWMYAVPLERHLTSDEGARIASSWGEWWEGDYEVTLSSPAVDPAEFGSFDEVEVDPDYERHWLESTDAYKHNRWAESMLAAGWRFAIDETAAPKTSVLLKPWHDLSARQQERAKTLWSKT